MTQLARRLQTYDDVLALKTERAELLAGEIVLSPSPSPAHQAALMLVGAELLGPFQRGRGGPGGWWLIPDVDVSFGAHDVVRPDLSGWRKDRVPNFPGVRPVRVRPDWVCEMLSPGSAALDQGEKKSLYAKSGVPFYWIVDPLNRTIVVLALRDGAFEVVAVVGDQGCARLVPFDEIELELDSMFPPRDP